MSLGNEYTGANVDFINDSTQEALNLKANLSGGNTFTGEQDINGYAKIDRVIVQAVSNDYPPFRITNSFPSFTSAQIDADKNALLVRSNTTLTNDRILSVMNNSKNDYVFSVMGDGKTEMKEINADGDINLTAGKQYLIDGVNILDAKANLSGGNTFTGEQDINGYAKIDRALIQATSNDYPPFKVTNSFPSFTTAQIDADKNALLVRSNTTFATDRIVSVMNNSKNDYVFSVMGDGKTEMKDMEVDGNINLTAGKQYLIDGVASVGISPAQAQQIVDNTNAIATKANDSDVVKLTGNQTISDVKTFSDDVKLGSDLLLETDAGVIKLGLASDRTIERTADGISTNATMNSTQYKVSGTQIASTDLGDNNTLVKTSGIQTIAGEKTFSDEMDINNRLNVTGIFKHTQNASTGVGIQLDNNNINQYALSATTQGYGWRWIGENTSGNDTDLFDIRTKKGGTTHKVFEVTNADNIRLTGNVVINTTSNKLNIAYAGIPLGSGVGNADAPVGALSGDIYRTGDNTLKITP